MYINIFTFQQIFQYLINILLISKWHFQKQLPLHRRIGFPEISIY